MKAKKALFAVGLGVLVSGVLLVNGVSGITYQDDLDVQFTFDPTLAMNLSSNRISIGNLSPGNSGYSNTVNVNIVTNSVYGYTLFAKVGGTGQTDASSNLVSASGAAFVSLNTSDKIKLANFSDSTWGYTTATAINSNSIYSGLAYNDNSIINMTRNSTGDVFSSAYPGTNSTNFTIGAKASSSQASGLYSNVITFTAVGNVVTDFTIDRVEYMQDFANMTPDEKQSVLDSMTEENQYQLKDSRDGKVYYVSKLKDGNVWMTQNLDHDIVATDNFYTYYNTDIGHGSTPDTNATWTGVTTYTTGDTTWNGSYDSPESYDPGDVCWDEEFSSDFSVGLEDGTVACSQNGSHLHIGNYYDWTAAVAMSDSRNSTQSGDDVDQSICPAGWMLPKIGISKGSFRNVAIAYGWDGTHMPSSSHMWKSPLYFILGGYWYNGKVNGIGRSGNYWTSVVYSAQMSYLIYFHYLDYVNPSDRDNTYRHVGHSLRCVVRR